MGVQAGGDLAGTANVETRACQTLFRKGLRAVKAEISFCVSGSVLGAGDTTMRKHTDTCRHGSYVSVGRLKVNKMDK